jgi:hypothetical protein
MAASPCRLVLRTSRARAPVFVMTWTIALMEAETRMSAHVPALLNELAARDREVAARSWLLLA